MVKLIFGLELRLFWLLESVPFVCRIRYLSCNDILGPDSL